MNDASTPRPTVAAVVVNWNGGDALLACLDSLHQQTRAFDRIVVVDNASSDGSLDAAARRFPALQIVRNDRNLGFGAGVNRGVAAAAVDWVALINNDAVLDHDWLAQTLAVLHDDTGMVACKIYLDRAARLLDKVGHRLAIDGQNFGRGHRRTDHGQYDALTEVAWPDGCAGLWRRAVFQQVGGLDEEFFAYADDADLGIRFRLAGWRCALAPHAIAEHRHSQTLGAYSERKLYLVERNRIWLAMKYFPLALVLLNPLLWLWRAALTARADRRGAGPWANVPRNARPTVLRALVRAQIDGWRGLPRQLRKRRALRFSCGPTWPARRHALLREARVSLADLANLEVA